jgi:YHS domain-containing protein
MVDVFCALCGKPLKRSPAKVRTCERFFCNKEEADTFRGLHPEIYVPKQQNKTRFLPALRFGGKTYG